MRRLAIGMALAVLLLTSLAPIWGQAYSAVLEDANLRVEVSYPPEVKAGTCFTVKFEAQAFADYTIDSIRLTLKLHREGGAETLYDQVLVSSEAVTSGWGFSKNIDICVPSPPYSDPFIEAKTSATYTLPAPETRTLFHEWYMTIVRRQTYEEIRAELNAARDRVNRLERKINDLREEVEDLREYVEDLKASLSQLSETYGKLSSDYSALQENYSQLQDQYEDLEQEYKALSEEYRQALVEYERLRTLYEELSDNHSQLQSNYYSILDDYQSLSKEYSQLKGVYEDLSARYSELKTRHEDALTTIGQLRETVAGLEEDLKKKQEELDVLSAMYNSAVNEGALTKNMLYAQSAAVAGIGAGIFIVSLRRRRTLPPPPPPPPPNEENGKLQRVLSGRRVTLPKEAAEKLGIAVGGRVRVEVLEDSVKITPIKEGES